LYPWQPTGAVGSREAGAVAVAVAVAVAGAVAVAVAVAGAVAVAVAGAGAGHCWCSAKVVPVVDVVGKKSGAGTGSSVIRRYLDKGPHGLPRYCTRLHLL
jgi:hypothetical protein